MADKLTHLIVDALTRAAAEPGGLPLFASRTDSGLFPGGAAAKTAANKCIADGLLQTLAANEPEKPAQLRHGITPTGWDFLLAHSNPKQVLEDLVRLLEGRRDESRELIRAATRMADGIDGIKEAVARVLPTVASARFPTAPVRQCALDHAGLGSPTNGRVNSTATFEPRVEVETELASLVRSNLTEWANTAAAGEDCPLPDLYRGLDGTGVNPTIGEFHDCLRALHHAGLVYLHPWTGPLYQLPEPAYAMLAGHNVAYYASIKQ